MIFHAFVAALASCLALTTFHTDKGFTLQSVENDISRQFPSVKQLSTNELASLLQSPDLVLLDVRQPQEFAVSHLPGAQRISPLSQTNHCEFNPSQLQLKNKTVVFYCSVGYRSSQIAKALDTELKKLGVSAVYNLQGGIFAWHNENRALVNQSGATDFVHPFDSHYGKLLLRQDLVSTTLR